MLCNIGILILANVRDELSTQHQQFIDEVEKSHASQMHTARIELERSIEISRQKVWLYFLLTIRKNFITLQYSNTLTHGIKQRMYFF